MTHDSGWGNFSLGREGFPLGKGVEEHIGTFKELGELGCIC